MDVRVRGRVGKVAGAVVLVAAMGAAGLSGAAPARAAAAGAAARYVFENVDMPGATGGTQVNGVNDRGDVDGSYVDAAGSHGFVSAAAGLISH